MKKKKKKSLYSELTRSLDDLVIGETPVWILIRVILVHDDVREILIQAAVDVVTLYLPSLLRAIFIQVLVHWGCFVVTAARERSFFFKALLDQQQIGASTPVRRSGLGYRILVLDLGLDNRQHLWTEKSLGLASIQLGGLVSHLGFSLLVVKIFQKICNEVKATRLEKKNL